MNRKQTMIDASLELDVETFRWYQRIDTYGNAGVTNETLADQTNCSISSFAGRLAELVARGWIVDIAPDRPNRYLIKYSLWVATAYLEGME